MEPMTMFLIGLGVLILIIILVLLSWYRVVSPSEAHVVVGPIGKMVVSPDSKIAGPRAKKWYFKVPILRTTRIMNLTTQELVIKQETYEKNQARYMVQSSTKFRIIDVDKYAERVASITDLKEQLSEAIISAVRAVTVQFDVVQARAKKTEMSNAVEREITDDLQQWGLELISFQLVNFKDTEESKIISNISQRREKEIEAATRQEVAERDKEARVKEAESVEIAKKREIAMEEEVSMREQNKLQKVSEQQKIAKEKEYDVIKVQTIRQAEIDKEKAIVFANQQKETEVIIKEQKKLVGEGDRLQQEEQAKGAAAPIREKGIAEAMAKEKLQVALNKFGDKAIRALVAEKVVEMQQAVGIATAGALEKADVKVFAGGEGSKQGFNLGEMIQSMAVADDTTSKALLNKLARPNDLGLSELDLLSKADKKGSSKSKEASKSTLK